MHRMRRWMHAVTIVIVAVLVGSACSAGGDKAGGAGETFVLRMGNTASGLQYSPAVEYFVTRVEEVSGGQLRIDLVNEYGDFATDAEEQVVGGVADGTIDLGFASSQGLSEFGIHDFEALDAPMLIDSYALEDAVVTSDITTEMLGGLGAAGITGLGLFAGPIHKPISVDGPLVAPSDFQGIGFGMYPSTVQEAAIDALGATPVLVFGPARTQALADGDIQGFEMTLLGYKLNTLEARAPYIAANVNLWAEPTVLFANPDRLETLSDEQRDWLSEAADDAASRSADLANQDADLVRTICESGGRIAKATEIDLAAFREVFAPVYASLEHNEATKVRIDRIEELKASTTPEAPLAIPSGCTGAAPIQGGSAGDAASSALNGTYRWTLSEEDAAARDLQDDPAFEHAFPFTFTVVLEDGTWDLTYIDGHGAPGTETDNGTFTTDGDVIAFDWPRAGVVLTFSFSVDESGSVRLVPILPMDTGDQFVWSAHDWTKIAGPTPAPASAELAGVYRYTITRQDAIDNGPPGEDLSQYPLLVTITLGSDGTWQGGEDSGTYTVSSDRVSFDWPRVNSLLVFTFSVDDQGNLELTPVLPMEQGDQLIWSSEMWTKIA